MIFGIVCSLWCVSRFDFHNICLVIILLITIYGWRLENIFAYNKAKLLYTIIIIVITFPHSDRSVRQVWRHQSRVRTPLMRGNWLVLCGNRFAIILASFGHLTTYMLHACTKTRLCLAIYGLI